MIKKETRQIVDPYAMDLGFDVRDALADITGGDYGNGHYIPFFWVEPGGYYSTEDEQDKAEEIYNKVVNHPDYDDKLETYFEWAW